MKRVRSSCRSYPKRLAPLLVLFGLQACASPRLPRSPVLSRTGAFPQGLSSSAGTRGERLEPGVLHPPPKERSLVAKITPRTSPRRAASLRLTEEGRKLIDSKEYARALVRLEKTLAVDSANPYAYYFLAQAHYHLGHYRDSLNFLDVAESLLGNQPFWLGKVYALMGENYRAVGSLKQARASYARALRLIPGDRVAARGLSRLQREGAGPAHR